MKTKAVIYARVSSSNDRQDTTRQIEDLRKYAVSQNIEIVNVFQEHISGAKKNEERQVLTDCLNYLNQSRLNLTVTYKKNKFVTENRLSYDNIRKGHQEQTGIA